MNKFNSLVKTDRRILRALRARKKELELTLTDIVKDAQVRGYKILLPSLSRYFNESDGNNLPEDDIRWLSARYCLKIGLEIEILPYDEFLANKELKLQFPKIKQ